MSENSLKVFNYVKEHEGENITAADIAEALDLAKRSVDGIITMAFAKKGLMARKEVEIELEDNSHKTVKFIVLTDEGRSFDPEATDAE